MEGELRVHPPPPDFLKDDINFRKYQDIYVYELISQLKTGDLIRDFDFNDFASSDESFRDLPKTVAQSIGMETEDSIDHISWIYCHPPSQKICPIVLLKFKPHKEAIVAEQSAKALHTLKYTCEFITRIINLGGYEQLTVMSIILTRDYNAKHTSRLKASVKEHQPDANIFELVKDSKKWNTFKELFPSGCEAFGYSPFVQRLLANQKTESNWFLRETGLKGPNGIGLKDHENMSCKDPDEVETVFKMYFPDFQSKLTSVPEISNIRGGVLYGHCDEKGEPVVNPKVERNNESGYKGEIIDVWMKCISLLPGRNGLLLNSFDEMCAQNLFTNTKPDKRFQMDWIYCSGERIGILEVGRHLSSSQRSEHNIVESKMEQLIKHSVPVIQQLIASVLQPEEAKQVLFNRMFYVVCLPNCSIADVNSCFANRQILKLTETTPTHVLSNLHFLTNETIKAACSGEEACIYRLQKHNGQFMISGVDDTAVVQLSNLLRADDEHREVAYLTALLAFANLSCPQAFLSIEDRFMCTQKRQPSFTILEEKYRESIITSGLILSPQQHTILKDNPKFLVIFGEAGTGKTTLLLARLLRYCGKQLPLGECKRAYFIIPERKTFFIDYVQTFVNKFCNSTAVKIIHTEDIDDTILDIRNLRENKRNKEQLMFLIDEIYYDSDNSDKALPYRINSIWLAVVRGGRQHSVPYNPAAVYEERYLTVLFRNSAPIATTATLLLNTEISSYSNSSAVLHQTFVANQSSLEVLKFRTVSDCANQINIIINSQSKNNLNIMVVDFSINSSLNEEVIKDFVDRKDISLIIQKISPYSIARSESIFNELGFSGVEFDLVIFVISGGLNLTLGQPDINLIYKFRIFSYCVMTRAVYGFFIVSHESIPGEILKLLFFIDFRDKTYSNILQALRGELPECISANDVTTLSNTYIHLYKIGFLTNDIPLIQELNKTHPLLSLVESYGIICFELVNQKRNVKFYNEIETMIGLDYMPQLIHKCFEAGDKSGPIHLHAHACRGLNLGLLNWLMKCSGRNLPKWLLFTAQTSLTVLSYSPYEQRAVEMLTVVADSIEKIFGSDCLSAMIMGYPMQDEYLQIANTERHAYEKWDPPTEIKIPIIFFACHLGYSITGKFLFSKMIPSDIRKVLNIRDEAEDTLFHHACEADNLDMWKLLNETYESTEGRARSSFLKSTTLPNPVIIYASAILVSIYLYCFYFHTMCSRI